MRVAILDDYQQVSLASTDWSAVRSLGQIDVFAEHISRTEALVSALEPYDVVVAMRERTPFGADRLGQLPRLRLLVTTGMGNASIDLEAAAARGVTVCGTGGIGSSTAELTWGLILALLRHIPEEDRRLKQAGRAGGAALGFGGGWQRTVGIGLEGKRLGVVGLGKLGQRVAEIGRAFGMKAVAWSQNLDPDVAKKAHVKAVSKEELFSSSDVVTVHYKLSPRSAGLVGAAELALMKPSAYLVNTSRGPLVDAAALLAALRSGSIAGAALDVYDVEPLPLPDPLRSAPNVVLTPHLGYVTEETYQVFYGDAAEDIVAFAKGSPVRVLTESLRRYVVTSPASRLGRGPAEPRRGDFMTGFSWAAADRARCPFRRVDAPDSGEPRTACCSRESRDRRGGRYLAGAPAVRGGAVLRRMMSLVGTVTARSISSPCSSPRTIWPASRPC
jgi:phosphoglycerate dehydrogenase-like enzyme